jgi:RNA polymerase sigma factor (sigma-70 family)
MPAEPKKILSRDEESRLVFLAKQGDADAYSALLAAFDPLLQSIVERHTQGFWNKEVNEDLRGAALLGFSQSIVKFQPSRNRRLATLLHLEVRRSVLEVIRANTKHRKYSDTEEKAEDFREALRSICHPNPDGGLEAGEDRFREVDEALAKLSERDAAVIRLLFFEGGKLSDVAVRFRLTVGQVRTELARVLSLLREELT